MHPYDVPDEKPAKLGAILYVLVMVAKSFLVYDRSIRNKIHKAGTMTIDVLPQGASFTKGPCCDLKAGKPLRSWPVVRQPPIPAAARSLAWFLLGRDDGLV
jgi:hypothetical protein